MRSKVDKIVRRILLVSSVPLVAIWTVWTLTDKRTAEIEYAYLDALIAADYEAASRAICVERTTVATDPAFKEAASRQAAGMGGVTRATMLRGTKEVAYVEFKSQSGKWIKRRIPIAGTDREPRLCPSPDHPYGEPPPPNDP